MIPTTRRRQRLRKSLRQSLRELLQRRRRQTNLQAGDVGSGILRKAGLDIYLPEPSRVSLFPDFESSTQFDISLYSVHIPNHFAGDVEAVQETLCSSSSASRVSLLPARSLSQFNLRQPHAGHGRPYRPMQLTTVPEILNEGASQQASLVSLNSLKHSRSTLRIRDSSLSLWSEGRAQPGTSCISASLKSRPRSNETSSDLRSLASFRTNIDDSANSTMSARTPASQTTPGRMPSSQPSIASIKHFGSFCVLDTSAPGFPVTATSEDLKYVFDVGEHFFLNNQECTDASVDIVTGFDADGNEVTHLVLFSPLVSPSSGRTRFLLAALIDVTFFIRDAATVPDMDTISEESFRDDSVITPVNQRYTATFQTASRKNVKYELSCEDLLGGCCIEEETRTSSFSPISERGIIPGMGMYGDMKRSPTPTLLDDVWTDLAQEEMIRTRKSRPSSAASTRSCHSTQSPPSLSASSSNASKVDNVLDIFMSQLQQLYSSFFLLAKSPLDAGFYEICNVSPSVYVTKDYVHGHLSQSSPDTITRLSELLGGNTAFDIDVRWGKVGETKQLYCVPLFGQRDLTWMCMLVDVKLGLLW